jgi:hypothetical protein
MTTCNRVEEKLYPTSRDEVDLRQKRDDVLRVCCETSADQHTVRLDRKTGMQASGRRHPDLPVGRGEPRFDRSKRIPPDAVIWSAATCSIAIPTMNSFGSNTTRTGRCAPLASHGPWLN